MELPARDGVAEEVRLRFELGGHGVVSSRVVAGGSQIWEARRPIMAA